MSHRALTAISAGAVLAIIAISVGVYVLLSDDRLPAGTGDVIAYSCKERKNVWYAVCVMKSDGSEKRHLTEQLTTTDPAWSPDGRRIAFTRNEDVGEYTTFTDDDVFVMDADGGNVRQLTPELDGSSSGQPTWSPDGRMIAFVRGRSVASAVVAATPLMFGKLAVMNDDGDEVRLLTRGEPDATALLVLAALVQAHPLRVQDRSGRSARKVARAKALLSIYATYPMYGTLLTYPLLALLSDLRSRGGHDGNCSSSQDQGTSTFRGG